MAFFNTNFSAFSSKSSHRRGPLATFTAAVRDLRITIASNTAKVTEGTCHRISHHNWSLR